MTIRETGVNARRKAGGAALVASAMLAALGTGAAFADGERYSGGGYKDAAPAHEHDSGYGSWTGPYIGIGVGTRGTGIDWTTTSLKFDSTGQTPSSFPSGSLSKNYDSNGLQFSGFAGYNYQVGGIVLGLEGVIAAGGDSNSRTRQEIPGATDIFNTKVPNTFDSVKASSGAGGGIRGRFGFLVRPDLMLFATGGIGFQQFGFHIDCQGSQLLTNASLCAQLNKANQSVTKTGWTVGAGVEARLTANWSARLEYTFASYDSADLTFKFPDGTSSNIASTLTAKTDLDIQTVTVGIAYKF